MEIIKHEIKQNTRILIRNEEEWNQVQKVCFSKGVYWCLYKYNIEPTLNYSGIIKDMLVLNNTLYIYNGETIQDIVTAEFFIKTNGTCIESQEYSVEDIDSSFIKRVQTEKIGVICGTREQQKVWVGFLDRYMPQDLYRYRDLYNPTHIHLYKVIANNTEYGNIYEWADIEGWFESKGFTIYHFNDIIRKEDSDSMIDTPQYNNFKDYGFMANFSGEILKEVNGFYIGYVNNINDFPIPCRWDKDGEVFDVVTKYDLTPIKPIKTIQKDWTEEDCHYILTKLNNTAVINESIPPIRKFKMAWTEAMKDSLLETGWELADREMLQYIKCKGE